MTATSTPAVSTADRLPPFEIASLLLMLAERAEPALSDEDCRWIANCTDEVKAMAANSAVFIDGVASLLVNDGSLEHELRAGELSRPCDVASMLHHVATTLRLMEGLLMVADQALIASDRLAASSPKPPRRP